MVSASQRRPFIGMLETAAVVIGTFKHTVETGRRAAARSR
jgi:hypothetical protein